MQRKLSNHELYSFTCKLLQIPIPGIGILFGPRISKQEHENMQLQKELFNVETMMEPINQAAKSIENTNMQLMQTCINIRLRDTNEHASVLTDLRKQRVELLDILESKQQKTFSSMMPYNNTFKPSISSCAVNTFQYEMPKFPSFNYIFKTFNQDLSLNELELQITMIENTQIVRKPPTSNKGNSNGKCPEKDKENVPTKTFNVVELQENLSQTPGPSRKERHSRKKNFYDQLLNATLATETKCSEKDKSQIEHLQDLSNNKPPWKYSPKPLKSNLKQRLDVGEDVVDSLSKIASSATSSSLVTTSSSSLNGSVQKKPNRSVNFDNVQVFYFPRQQGSGCVPSAGECTLGMEARHVELKTLSLAEHAAELKQADRMQLKGMSNNQRKKILKEAGVRMIDTSEKAELRDIRYSREVCGCSCRDICYPETCACFQSDIKCQVDKDMFPCGCSRDACGNTIGRVEFNQARVKTHLNHTLMRLKMENRKPQNPTKICSVLEENTKDQSTAPANAKLQEQLMGGRFRFINEQLYTMDSVKAQHLFKQDPEAFKAYHEGYRHQVEKWPMNPLHRIIKKIKKIPKSLEIGDFGCGEGRLAEAVPHKVYSMDLVSCRNDIIACDMAHTPLATHSLDVAVYCLSLMGTNLQDYLLEANRVLKMDALVLVAEIQSRIDNIKDFVKKVDSFGFQLCKQGVGHKLFYFFEFKKVRNIRKVAKVPQLSLKPRLYS